MSDETPDDGWVPWSAGVCPVEPNTLVDVRHADGTVSERTPAGDAIYLDADFGFDWWAHIDCLPKLNAGGFIIAYRVVKP